MEYLNFEGPWANSGTAVEEVAVYLPPGYDKSGSKRYPAVYEAPFLFNVWNAAFHVKETLDSLINAGTIPPSIFMFMNAGGGPYSDTQCADTWDGREKMDRFMGVTVPDWIDTHYRTIAKPAARAVMGMSEGGYCAAILILHHPDVFGSAISFSGYFAAGVGSASAPIPFGNNQTLLNNDSPTYVAARLDPDVRPNIYYVIVAQRSQEFYGSGASDFAKVLDHAGIAYSFINADDPHGWPQVRNTFSQALTLVGMRMAESGVFD
jgi:S-formylglutathione hydrolase FrmB